MYFLCGLASTLCRKNVTENLGILWVVFTLHKYGHLWQMIYSMCLLSGLVSFIWLGWKLLERDCSYPGSNRAYFRGKSHASEKEGWREGGKNVACRSSERCWETAEKWQEWVHKLNWWRKWWGGGDCVELAADQKASELLELDETWKRGVNRKGECHKPLFTVCLAKFCFKMLHVSVHMKFSFWVFLPFLHVSATSRQKSGWIKGLVMPSNTDVEI